MPIQDIILSFIIKEGKLWLDIMKATIFNLDIIWITLPVYVNWFATEYFQEKKETSYGNAATNGVIAIWVALDWIRQMVMNIGINYVKLFVAILNMLYGFFIIREAIKQNPVAKHLGRVKDISYLQVALTPIMYDIIQWDLKAIISIFLFFPIVHFGTNILIDKLLPNPFKEEGEEEKISFKEEGLENIGESQPKLSMEEEVLSDFGAFTENLEKTSVGNDRESLNYYRTNYANGQYSGYSSYSNYWRSWNWQNYYRQSARRKVTRKTY